MAQMIIVIIALLTTLCNIIGSFFLMKNDLKHLAKDLKDIANDNKNDHNEMKASIARLEELHLKE